MKQHFVRVQREFLNSLHRAGIPRITRKMEDWLATAGYGAKRGCLTKLLKGEMVRPLYVVKLVQYLLLNNNQGDERQDYLLVADYLRQLGKGELLDCSPHKIADALIDFDRTDWLLDATKRFIALDYLKDLLVPDSLLCKSSDIQQATEWMTLDFAKQLQPQREEMTQGQADSIFKKAAGFTRLDFLALAEQWHDYDPWTCIQGCVGKQQLGMSLALPLKVDAYLEFRGGKRQTNDFDVSDLERPSRFIMFQALTTNPKVRGLTPERVNKTLVGHVIHQIAMLSYSDGALGCQPLHVVTFACTAQMEARLESDGYQRMKACVPGTKMPIYERRFTDAEIFKSKEDFLLTAIVNQIGKTAAYQLMPHAPAEPFRKPDLVC